MDINEQLTRGSFQVICEIVRDLTAGRPLPEAIQEVTTLLQAGEETYKVLTPHHP